MEKCGVGVIPTPFFVMSEVYNSLTMSYLFLYRRFIVLKYIEVYNYSEPQG
jgi:hypothetical protein